MPSLVGSEMCIRDRLHVDVGHRHAVETIEQRSERPDDVEHPPRGIARHQAHAGQVGNRPALWLRDVHGHTTGQPLLDPRHRLHRDNSTVADHRDAVARAVSYTHLTLPTIYSV